MTLTTQVVADSVRAEMARKRVSQTAIAGALGLSQAAVSARLRGAVSWRIDELAAVAALLDVPLASLTAGTAA